MLSGNTKSCGCLNKELKIQRKLTHGDSANPTRLYRIWSAMKTRCCNPNSKRYRDYGERGVVVCEEWMRRSVVYNEGTKQ